jgi:hypothetical protein
MSKTFLMIWPERRVLTAEQIEVWFDDAVANDELTKDEDDSVEDKAMALDSLGRITLGSK